MDHMEMAEKLRKKANVTLSEAKEVLERNHWDMLEAMIELEREGKTYEEAARAQSDQGQKSYEKVQATASQDDNAGKSSWKQFCDFIDSLLRKGMDNYFIVTKDKKQILSVPVLALVLVAVFLFELVAILLIVGLFCGCQYTFQGKELGKDSINDRMKTASEAAQDIADQVKSAAKNE
mgnify:CR=1 FL=1